MTKRGTNQHDIVPALVILLSAVAMAWWTWGTWTDPFVDSGRELYLAWRVLAGQQLYSDVASFNGPLSPFVNALWFHLVGVSLRALVIGNLALLGAFLILLYSTLRTIADRLAATVAVTVFVLLFAFGEYDIGGFNYVVPYSHELVHGLFLSIAAIRSLAWYARTRTPAALFITGLCLGATLLTKPEIALAAIVSGSAGAGLLLWREQGSAAKQSGAVAAVLVGMLVPPGLAVMMLTPGLGGSAAAVSALLQPFLNVAGGQVSALPFYTSLTGLSQPVHSIRLLLIATLAYAALFGAAARVSFAKAKRRRGAESTFAFALVVFLGGLAGFRAVIDGVARPYPVLMLALAAVTMRQVWRRRDGESIVRLTLVLFAGLTLGKIALNAHLYRYGFVLAVPATVAVIVALLDWLPAWLETRGADPVLFRRVALTAIAMVAMLFLAAHTDRLRAYRIPVGDGGDRFLADERARPLNAMVAEINQRLGPGDRLMVVPEGVMLNYLTRRPSSSPYPTFLPPEMVMFGEDRVVASLRDDPPEFVVLLDRPMAEYGLRFGEEYPSSMLRWIRKRYTREIVVAGIASPGASFGLELWRRVEAP